VARLDRKMGVAGVPTANLVFQDCRVPAANLIGEENRGFRIALATMSCVRPIVGARGLGLAQGALAYALDFARERRTFGRPILEHQAIQFMLADMATQVEAARALTYAAARTIDAGAKNVSRVSAMAKVFASDTAMRVTTDAVQIYGGYGYMKEYPVEKMMRDAKITQIYEGTNQIQREIIGLQLIKESLQKKE